MYWLAKTWLDIVMNMLQREQKGAVREGPADFVLEPLLRNWTKMGAFLLHMET